VSRFRIAALIACGAALAALSFAGVRLQFDDRLDRFVIVSVAQSVIYAGAVWLAWNGWAGRGALLAIAALAIAMRVPPLAAPPALSSDAYRYVWDGRVEGAGFNPYLHAPADPELETLRDPDVYPQIASKYAPSIYPPIAEAIFLAVTRASASVTAMKLAAVLFEIITVVLLWRLLALDGLPASRVLVYAWHPLPIWEFAGSGHIDAALIALSVAALWAVRRERPGLGGLFLAGATLTKFYPAVLLPALYRRWDWPLPACFVALTAVAYLPFISAGWQVFGFLPGYARQEGFDGNGAGFYVLGLARHVPWLAGLSAKTYALFATGALAILSSAFVFARERARPSYAKAAALAALFTVLVSPHYPWYFCWLVVFACFLRSFALLWLTNACFLLYLVTDYVFVPSGQLVAIESVIYGPFAALALIDLCYYRRRAGHRS
jgi:alpha-1,6-mannosyltransferase